MASRLRRLMRKDPPPAKTQQEYVNEQDKNSRIVSAMKSEYMSFQGHYMDLSDFYEPRRGRFYIQDRNRGDGGRSRYGNIINNHATISLRKARAGMHGGIASPARPWFVWDMLDRDLLHKPDVREWLYNLRDMTLKVLQSGNFYQQSPTLIGELLQFGTGCMTHVDDFNDVARFKTHTIGSYYININDKDKVTQLAREYQLNTYQMVAKFGLENVSQSVRDQYNRGNYNNWYTVNHLIQPNPDRDDDEALLNSEFMPYQSLYWETKTGSKGHTGKYLKREGFRGFPAYVPRWETTNEGDIYATNCPGMTCLGDVKQLQTQEREKAKALAKMVSPPLQGPPSMQHRPITNLPGGMTYGSSNNGKIESLYDVRLPIQELVLDIERTEGRIDSGFYIDLFMAITDQDGIQPKNELQLSQMDAERLLQLGPVLEQVHGEYLARVVGKTAQQILDAGMLPPPPEELDGVELQAEFVSAIAMAQRAVTVGAIEKTAFFVGQLTEIGIDVLDKYDADYAVDQYALLSGAPPELIRSTDEANEARQQKAQAAQQQQMMEMAQGAANVAKMASDSKLEDDNALSRAVDGAAA